MTVKELIVELQKHHEDLVVNVGSADVYPTVYLEEFVVQPGFEGAGTVQLAISAAEPINIVEALNAKEVK